MPRLMCCLLMLLICTSDMALAQTAEWPLSAEQIIASDSRIEYSATTSDETPWSDELRVLSLDGSVYRYPAQFQRIYGIAVLDDNTILIEATLDQDDPYGNQLWMVDHRSQQLTPFESPCTSDTAQRLHAEALVENPWTIISSSSQAVLCNHLSGERSVPLPEGYFWDIDRFGFGPLYLLTVSPDTRYVAFIGQAGAADSPSISSGMLNLFSYDTITGQFVSVGEFYPQTALHFERWVGTSLLFENGETCNVCSMSVYIADITQADSIEEAFGYFAAPAFLEDPPRYGFGVASPYSTITCGYQVYDVATRTMHEYELGGCRPDYGTAEGVGYYRNVPMQPTFECCELIPEAVPTVAVTRWDTRSGESRDIYVGEVEEVRWVSSDDRYAILLLDNNGVIDNVPYSWNPPRYGFPTLHLVDMETGRSLTYVQAYEDPIFREPLFTILPLNDREFLMIDCTSEACDGPTARGATYLTIDDKGNLQKRRLLDRFVIRAAPDGSSILYWTHPSPPDANIAQPAGTVTGVGFYDIETGERWQLVDPLDPDLYSIRFEVQRDEDFVVLVRPKRGVATTNSDSPEVIIYSLRFAAGEAPIVEITHSFPAVGKDACLLHTTMGAADLRLLPGSTQVLFVHVEQGQSLLADGQFVNEDDGQVWWRLADGGWIASALTLESDSCESLPLVDPDSDALRIPELLIEI